MISRALVAILLMMNLGVAAWALWGPAPDPARARDAAISAIPRLRLLAEAEPVAAPLPAAAEIGNAQLVASDAVVAGSVPALASPPAHEPDVAADHAAAGAAGAVADAGPGAAVVTGAAPALASPPAHEPDVAADHAVAGAAGAVADAGPGTAVVTDGEPPAPDVTYHCFSIGPFVAIDDLRRTSALIENAVQRQQVREVRSSEVRGYRVYLAAFASRQEAMDAARMLQEKGLRDYYVVTAGEQENTVSLGLFRDLSNAEARREMVRGFGFEPRLEPRQQELTRWWLDIAVAVDDTAWRQQATRYPGTRIENLACQ